jgi:hypothetical protein
VTVADLCRLLIGDCFLFSGSLVWPVGSPGLAPVPLPVIVLVVGTGWVPCSAGRRPEAFGEAGGLLQEQFQEVPFRCCFREQQLVAAGAGDDFPCGREEPVAPAFDIPGFGVVSVREGGELEPGDEVEGQGGDVGPGLVRCEIEEGQLAQAGVFQGLDPVLAPAAGPVPGVQERSVPAG